MLAPRETASYHLHASALAASVSAVTAYEVMSSSRGVNQTAIPIVAGSRSKIVQQNNQYMVWMALLV